MNRGGGGGGRSARSGNEPRGRNNSNSNSNKGGGGARRGQGERRAPPPDPIVGGALSLVEHLDKHVVVVLRDKKTIMGVLRSFDGYANVVLENAAERVYVGDCYGDLPIKGWFVVRAENVVLLGELDPARQDADVKHLKRVDTDIIVKLRKVQREKEEERRKVMLDFVDELMIGDDGF